MLHDKNLGSKIHWDAHLTQQETKPSASMSLQFKCNTRSDWQMKIGFLIVLINLIKKGFQNVSWFSLWKNTMPVSPLQDLHIICERVYGTKHCIPFNFMQQH